MKDKPITLNSSEINITQCIESFKRKQSELGQYTSIMERAYSTDVSADAAFQKDFNYFYKVRRNEEWRKTYYKLFEECKHIDNIDFSYILHALYERTKGNIEASFSSKMLATLNPDMPIWDSIVLARFGLKPSASDDKTKRLDSNVKLYDSIMRWYQEFLQTSKAQEMITAFDAAFPKYAGISSVKKIDFLLWGSEESQQSEDANK